MRRAGLALVWTAFAFPACISTNPPPPIRWFDPSVRWSDPARPDGVQTDDARADNGTTLQLRPVTASAFLRQEMVWRIAQREVFIDETNRWVADPTMLVQHALELALYVEGPFRRVDVAAENEIQVHVLAFEGDLSGPPRARVRLLLRSYERPPVTVEALADAAGDRPEHLAEAMATALRDAAVRIREHLTR